MLDDNRSVESIGSALRLRCFGPWDLGKMLWTVTLTACDGNTQHLNEAIQSFEASAGQVQAIESIQPPAPLVMDRRDDHARRLICANLKKVFRTELRTLGSRTIPEQQRADSISAAIHSSELETGCGFESVERVVGVKKTQMLRGAQLNARNKEHRRTSQEMMLPRAERKDKRDLEWIYDWFHHNSPDVELNKNDKSQWSKKTVFCAGRERKLTCVKRVLTTSRQQAVCNFKASQEWKDHTRKNPRMTLHDANIAFAPAFRRRSARNARARSALPWC